MDKISENKKPIAMVIMAIIAIVIAVVVIKPFGGDDTAEVIDEVQDRTAVYAKTDIPIGTIITSEMVEVKSVDEGVDVNAIENESRVIGTEALADISQGSAIESDDVEDPTIEDIPDPKEEGLSDKVPEGLRAVLMPTGPAQEIVSFLNVGDRVDLLITHSKNDGYETTTPFKNVEVLLLDENTVSPPPVEPRQPNQPAEEEKEPNNEIYYSGGGSDVSSVILAMTPKQAEEISNMRISGVLQTVQITIINGNE